MESAVSFNGKIFRTGCNPVDDVGKLKAIPNLKDVQFPKVTRDDAINYCNTKVFQASTYFGADWIGNQGNAGSCNGYAGAKALQRARVRRRLKMVPLSGEGLYAQINGGQDNGSQLVDGMKTLKTGVPSEAVIRPREKIYLNQFPSNWKEDAARFTADECYQLLDEDDVITALVLGFDLVVAVHVGNNWQQMDANGVIPYSPGMGNHAVGVDDIAYKDGRFLFEHYGSWGPSIHRQGRAYVTWENQLNFTVKYHGFYAIRSSSDDKQDKDNPVPLKV